MRIRYKRLLGRAARLEGTLSGMSIMDRWLKDIDLPHDARRRRFGDP